jgi:hypothetical protein
MLMMKKPWLFLFLWMLILGTSLTSAQEPGSPIPSDEDAEVEAYIGAPAVPQPIDAPTIPTHPFMAANGQSNTHNDAYMSDTYVIPGPLGQSPEVLSSYLDGVCVTMAFDQAGRIISGCLNLNGAQLFLIDPTTLAPLATLELPSLVVENTTEFPSGSYFYLDHNDHVMLPTVERTVWELAIVEDAFQQVKVHDLSTVVPEGDSIGSVLPDFSGRLWFVTHGGIVGTLDPQTGATASLALEGEAITNSFAVDETGVFIASDHAMYGFQAGEDGEPVIVWREEYDRGSQVKPGQTSQGTGTTPTLMGAEFVTIADNAEPQLSVLVYRRQPDIEGARLVCQVPVFGDNEGSTENSLVATDNAIVVENNYGYRPLAVTGGRSTAPGMTRINVNPDGTCEVAWTSEEHIPSLISKLSLATGLIYTYTKEDNPGGPDAWYFTAIDFETGETVFKQLTGIGISYNNHYSGVYLGPDGTAYVGVIGGMVALRDTGE